MPSHEDEEVGALKMECHKLRARVAELEAQTVASAEIEEGTIYGTEEAIQGLRRTLEAGVVLARQLNRLITQPKG